MATSPAAHGRAGVARLYAHVRQPAPDMSAPGLFSPQLRRYAVLWVILTLPVVAAIGRFATTPQSYLLIWVLCASGFYTTPALLHTWLAVRRAPRADKLAYRLWMGALVAMYIMGCGMVFGTLTGVPARVLPGALSVSVISLLLMTAIVVMVRSRSGGRALSVDLVEAVMSVIVVIAPLWLLGGHQILHAEAPWYAIPSTIAVPCTVFEVY